MKPIILTLTLGLMYTGNISAMLGGFRSLEEDFKAARKAREASDLREIRNRRIGFCIATGTTVWLAVKCFKTEGPNEQVAPELATKNLPKYDPISNQATPKQTGE